MKGEVIANGIRISVGTHVDIYEYVLKNETMPMPWYLTNYGWIKAGYIGIRDLYLEKLLDQLDEKRASCIEQNL